MKIGTSLKVVAAVAAIGTLSACLEDAGGASVTPVRSTDVPAFSASWPNFIEANSDGSGQVFINAQAADVTRCSDFFYEAVSGDVTVSISQNAAGALSVTYNKRGVGNGVGQMTAFWCTMACLSIIRTLPRVSLQGAEY